jgi:Bacterial sugar transferase
MIVVSGSSTALGRELSSAPRATDGSPWLVAIPLPQIWNVLCAHMSLVGPRPERPEFVAELRTLPDSDLRHLIRPGLTRIAQLTGGYA